MRGHRVQIVAASGIAAALFLGALAPMPRLMAQKAEEAPKAAPEPKPASEAPAPSPADAPLALPADPSSPPVPAEPTPADVKAPADARTPEGRFAEPEAAAQAFIERSQKEADQAIGALGQEAETLRARLRKVEAGLARWQAVKDSLGATSAAATAGARPAWHRGGEEAATKK
jgi:hypothetical protein